MKYFIFSLITFFILINFWGFSQDVSTNGSKTSEIATKYNRIAITAMILDNNTDYIQDLKNATSGIIVPSKFDDNLLQKRYLSSASNNSAINKSLITQGIPNDILSKWFSHKESGEFDMSVIHQRGMYNATDDEVVKASASKIGLAKLKDAGESLINNSYVMVLEFSNIQDVQKKYDEQDAAAKKYAENNKTEFKPVIRRTNGWEGDVKAYLYKMNFNDSVMNVFYNDIWIYEDDSPEVKAEKIAKFNQTQFPLVSIIEVYGTADGSQYNQGEILAPPVQLTRDQLFQKMINTGITNVVFEIERKREEFRVKSPLYGTNPLKAKIGKKEGLYTEQRFFVFEFEQNRNGETVAKRKGVVRTKKVVDNMEVATGQSVKFSTFYQVAGFGLMEGMLMQQRNDFGLGISGGTSYGEMGGGYVKAEANIGAMTGRIIDLELVQWKVFGSVHFQTKEYSSNLIGGANKYDMNFIRFQTGLSKGWYFGRSLSFSLYATYGMESATNEDWIDDMDYEEGQSIGTDFLNFGASASLNITYWMQIIGGINYYIPFGGVYDKDRKTEIFGDNRYADFFAKREGMSFDVGLRIEF
ncbi:MAG: hypothetical protein WCX31_01970 [Salinivirgaceae bacterium]|jgi:hypothetical protein